MAAQPQERVRKRLVWFSPVLLAVALTPVFLQTQYSCQPTGDTRLASLELEVLGIDQLAFDPVVRVYDVTLQEEAQATVRALSMDPNARVTWYVPDGDGMLASGTLGVGGGEVTIDLPPDGYALYIGVYPPGGAINTYIVNVNSPACPEDGNVCTVASWDPLDGTCGQAPSNEGGRCDFSGPGAADGQCFGGTCIFFPPDCGTTSGTVQIGCSNSITTADRIHPFTLTVTVNEPVFAGQPFTADASGIGTFPKFFLDAAQNTVPGGLRTAIVEGFNATVEANNGSGQILLQADPSAITPGLTRYCTFPGDQTCTADGDCFIPPCNPPVLVIDLPISTDCGAGGFCEGLGQGFADGPAAQCNITDPPEFCVASEISIPLYAPGGPQALTAGASGDVVFNWAVDPATITCPATTGRSPGCQNGDGGIIPDGAYFLPSECYPDPACEATSPLNGIRMNFADFAFAPFVCSGGQEGGACVAGANAGLGCRSDADCPGSTCAGVGVNDGIIMPTDLSTVPTRCQIW